MTPLPVDVGRSDRRTIETVESHDAAGPFTVAITNHGDDAHVHLRPDDDLARVARLEGDGNYYVEAGETRRVRVDADPSGGSVTGGLYVETGYGAERVRVEVTVGPPAERDVDVDETLSQPPGSDGEADDQTGTGADADGEGEDGAGSGGVSTPEVPEGTLPVAALAVAALAIAALTATVVDSAVVVAGIVVVLAAVVVAGVMLVK